MSKEESNNKTRIGIEYKILAKNSFYSFINSYSSFFFSLITSFIMARIISQEVWSYFIIALSYTALFALILSFLPPSLGLTYNYFIPKFRALKQFTKLKSFIFKSFILRILFVIIVFIVSFLIMNILSDLFRVNLKNYYSILLILSPMIIINGLSKSLLNLNRALNRFKTVFYLIVVKNVLNIGGLLFIFLFSSTIELSSIAYITIISSLIPFLFNILNIFILLKFKTKNTDEEKVSFKEVFKNLYSYGSPLSIRVFIDNFIKEFRIQAISFFEPTEFVTGYHISMNYKSVSGQLYQSLPEPLTISFTELNTKKKHNEIKTIFNTLFHYVIFLILIVTGLLIFFVDFFLATIYGSSYLRFSLLLKLALVSLIFNVMSGFFHTLLRAFRKINYVLPISTVLMIITFSFFLIGLFFFGINAALIGITIGNFLNFLIYILFTYRIFKIKINIVKVLLQYTIFFISFGLVVLLEIIILDKINTLIFETLNLPLLKHLPFLSLLVFLLIFLTLNIIFKIITKTDIGYIENFFVKDTYKHKIMRSGLRTLKKIVR
ncbi:MAG: lipopolysaccharide biosynthesis protein [Candidatus Hodarchaeales archaeon]|jgi:O-antigen/teichoic acid export membrane protein